MFVYAKNMQLALSDKLHRLGLAAGAGVVLILGAGFLLAALWTWLAYHLGWGSLGASLAIGLVMVVIGVIFLMMAKHERHPMPSTDELKAEVQQQLHLAADTAIAKVTGALATLGTQSKSVGRQVTFLNKLQDATEAGIGNLVDADLAKESAKLTALQTKQQLGVQALSIANSSSSVLLSLFR